MEDFAAGRLQVLISTTVVEVGIDVPNASVMLIENAERFGLSQLISSADGSAGVRSSRPASWFPAIGGKKTAGGWRSCAAPRMVLSLLRKI